MAQSYDTADEFEAASMTRVRSHCFTALFKLATFCTPQQLAHFDEALPVLHDLLTAANVPWSDVHDTLQALSHLVHAAAQLPQGLDAFFGKKHRFFETAVAMMQSAQTRDEVRWSACSFVWSVVQHCGAEQARHLLRLTGILGQVFTDASADSNVRAGALNTLQVLLQRGEVFVEQFVHHRDALASNVMEHVRTYAYEELVYEGDPANVNCIMKYASFTLTSAVTFGNKDQLIRLLDMGVYPLLFKIIALEGEEDKPEEAKLRAARALQRLLEVCREEVVVQQERAARRQFYAQGSWDMARGLVTEVASRAALEEAGHGTVSGTRDESGFKLRWSKELRDCVSELVVKAQEIGLC
jgi:hypothetical protein